MVDRILHVLPDIASAYADDIPGELHAVLEVLGVSGMRRPPTGDEGAEENGAGEHGAGEHGAEEDGGSTANNGTVPPTGVSGKIGAVVAEAPASPTCDVGDMSVPWAGATAQVPAPRVDGPPGEPNPSAPPVPGTRPATGPDPTGPDPTGPDATDTAPGAGRAAWDDGGDHDPLVGRGTVLVPVDAVLVGDLQRWSGHLEVGFSELLAGAVKRYLRHLAAGDGSGPPRPWTS
jgi:hypothetical protein